MALSAESLRELALDLRWSWNHSADGLWAELEPELWERTRNPWVVLQTVSPQRLERFLESAAYQERLHQLLAHRHEHYGTPAWFPHTHADAVALRVAYFSMEFALSEALPIYSGGLGNVAADQLKAACDLDVPITGIGLLWQQGYFRQVIRDDGGQDELYPFNDPGQLPITPVRDASGEWLRLPIELLGPAFHARVWKVQVGRRELFLLDSNDPANPPASRAIASELYGGSPELRLQQEIMLGIGGWRLLRALHREPHVCHLNEGHAALAVLERARSYMIDRGCSFDVAAVVTRAGNVFTTHTPVPAGFDRFAPDLMERYLGRYAEEALHIRRENLMGLGRGSDDPADGAFNMAYLAVRGSAAVNGVSRLHGAVSRRVFQSLFPRWPEREVPIAYVTNGIHVPTWQSAAADSLWSRHCGHECWCGDMSTIPERLSHANDEQLWTLRTANREALTSYINALGTGLGGQQPGPAFDPHVLTLGFARRFATYKRPTLLLHDADRLARLLADRERPVQLVVAGKAHPADETGQAMIAEWIRFARRTDVRGRVVFVPDYDLAVAERLVQGVDVWINTPRRMWEASGTSGMKILVNGGLNLSELDGWWAEAYSPDVGWSLDGSPSEAGEADALYVLLERDIVPMFYDRGDNRLPAGWLAKVRSSMARLTIAFSSNRVIREYTERYYLPAFHAYEKRSAEDGGLGRDLAAWQRHVADGWHTARFGRSHGNTHRDHHEFRVEVSLGQLDPASVRVELIADAIGEAPAVCEPMQRGDTGASDNTFEFSAKVPATRPIDDFTPRLVPYHPEAVVPLETANILWQR